MNDLAAAIQAALDSYEDKRSAAFVEDKQFSNLNALLQFWRDVKQAMEEHRA